MAGPEEATAAVEQVAAIVVFALVVVSIGESERAADSTAGFGRVASTVAVVA